MYGSLWVWGSGLDGELGFSGVTRLEEPNRVHLQDILGVKTSMCLNTITMFITVGGHLFYMGKFTSKRETPVLSAQKVPPLRSTSKMNATEMRGIKPTRVAGLENIFVTRISVAESFIVAASGSHIT
jgi:hypothetical protein